jgi:hypothetical protein
LKDVYQNTSHGELGRAGGEGVAQVVEDLPSKLEAMSSNSSAAKKKVGQ